MPLNKNIKQILSLYSATILSLVLGIGISIFTTRMLGPDDYGNFKFYQTIFSLVVLIFTFGSFNSISRLLAHEKLIVKVKQFYGVYALLVLFLGLFAWMAVFIFSFFQSSFFTNNLDLLFRYFGFLIILMMLNNSLGAILQGSNRIGLLSVLKVLPPISFLFILWISKELSLSQVIVYFYGSIGLYSLLILIFLKPKFKNISSVFNQILLENKEFGRKIYFGSLSNVATGYLGGILIAYYLENRLVGFFTLAITICSPLLMIPSIVGTTFFKEFAIASKINKKILFLTTIISVLSYGLFYILIEPVVHIFYPSEFNEVIVFSRLIAIGSMLHGFGDLYNRFLYAKGKGKLIRNGAIVVGVLNIVGYFVLIKYFGINGALITKVIAGVVYFLLMFVGYKIYLKNN